MCGRLATGYCPWRNAIELFWRWPMIDPVTRQLLEVMTKQAVREGTNLWEDLDRRGLLVTDQTRRKIWAQCLTALAIQISEQQVTAFVRLGGGQNTPLDTFRGILEYIDFFMKVHTGEKGSNHG